DRDHRIKIQFHWQRGTRSSHRLAHPAGDNAPASDASGTWVRVSEAVAGANWGSHFTPRLGQEVLVGFLGGDIDRPVVMGAVYNGLGRPDAQSNQASAGAAGAGGCAPAWFPGEAAEGRLQAHQHGAVLSGHKSQELASSASGSGGCNQLVLDDSPGQGRIELSSSSAQTRLQIGHLLQQTDNRRQQPRGHGLDLATQAWGAVRAASGLLISAHGKPCSTAGAMQMDTREPRTQLEQSAELARTLADSAHQHDARLQGEPEPAAMSFAKGLLGSQESLKGSDTTGDSSSGGAGAVPTLARPDVVIAAPGGITSSTPAHTVASASNTASFVAGQDLQQLAQANSATVVKDGLVFFTYGMAQNPRKPNTETGIQLHAATGNVNTQSQQGATRLTADRAISVTSTHGMVKVAAPQHILLTAAGAAIRIEGGNITLSAPGKVEFRA
ncbi:type VI secretion system Vgr family protein, partial [Rubrivivax gelatinosus]